MIVKSYFFGVCSPNPGGKASYTCMVSLPKDTIDLIGMARITMVKTKVSGAFDGLTLSWHHDIGQGEGMTNNRSTYEALVGLLLRLNELGLRFHFNRIYSDSLMVVNQMSGYFQANKGTYLEQYHQAKELMRIFPYSHLLWIPKTQNLARTLSTQLYIENL